jgi:S1-C subfamily serine protease
VVLAALVSVFAIPINRVKEIVAELKEKKTIDRNFYHGMEVREIDETNSKIFEY